MSMHIRPAALADVPVILQLIRDLAEYEKLSHEVRATSEMLEKWLFGQQPVAEVLIAEWEGTPRGFALFFHNFSTFLGKPGFFLEDLYVEPGFRGRGIGKALLLHLARLAVERGYGRVEWSVLDWNEPSIGFYRSLGARPMDDWTVYRLADESLAYLADLGSPGSGVVDS